VRRAHEKEQLQQVREAAARAEPVVLPATPVRAGEVVGRRVLVRGTFDADRTVLLDNRTHGGVAGFHVFTPVRLEGSDLRVLVLRGWIAGDPHARTRVPDVRTPAGPIEVEGLAEPDLAASMELAREGPPTASDRIWQNVSVERFARWSSLAVEPFIVRQAAGPVVDDGHVRDWVRPGDDVQKHRAYAFQWYLMAAVTAGLWVRFVLFRRRREPAST
jgi:cytochrome oxidase assembly protein ShyY1